MTDPVIFRLSEARSALEAVRAEGKRPFTIRHTRGTMVLELYGPSGVDDQQPHSQDELYFVTSGTGIFVCGDDRVAFSAGDALFAAAGVPHRFEDFSDDFDTWVVFYGADGGELPSPSAGSDDSEALG